MPILDDIVTAMTQWAAVDGTIRPLFYLERQSDSKQFPAIDPKEFITWCNRNGLSTKAFASRANSFIDSAGKQTSRGYMLLTRSQMDELGTSAFNLVVEEATDDPIFRGKKWTALKIDRIEAIHPGYDPNIAAAHKTPGETVCLVYLVDRRESWKHQDAENKQYNVLYGHNESVQGGSDQIGYVKAGPALYTGKDILDDLSSLLEPAVTLNYVDETDPFLTGTPEGIKLVGMTVWDAMHELCRQWGFRLSIDPTGDPWVLPSVVSVADQNAFASAISTLNSHRLVDHKGFDHQVEVPKRVNVYFPNRDFQFQDYPNAAEEPIAYSPGEVMQFFPFHVEGVGVGAFPPPIDATNDETHYLWSSVPRLTNDSGQDNEATLAIWATQLVDNYLSMLGRWEDWKEWTYSGFVDYTPLGPYSGVAYWDFGGGLHTKIFNHPLDHHQHANLLEFSIDDFLEHVRSPIEAVLPDPVPGTPDVNRDHPVPTRLMPGVCTESPGPVNQDEFGDFAIRWGVAQGSSVSWNNWITIQAAPYFAQITNGSPVLLFYNWQLGAGGKWQALGFQASGAQQHPAETAIAILDEDMTITTGFDWNDLEANDGIVKVFDVQYLSPDPQSQPWTNEDDPGDAELNGTPVTSSSHKIKAKNQFNLMGRAGSAGSSSAGSQVLLKYDKLDPTRPMIVQVTHEQSQYLNQVGNLTATSQACWVPFPTIRDARQLAPFTDNPGDEQLTLHRQALVQSITWDNDKCELTYEAPQWCVFPGPQNQSGYEQTKLAVKFADIRDQCFPCDPCACDCASFDTSIKLTITSEDEHPSSCSAVHTDPSCRGNFDGVLCNEIILNEISPDAAPGGSACHETLPTPTRTWKGTITCPNGTGDPSSYNVYVACDPASDPPTYSVCVSRGDTDVLMDEQPSLICADECGCFLAESDMNWGNHTDLCGNTLSVTCRIWWWFNLLPSKGGYFCCEDQLP